MVPSGWEKSLPTFTPEDKGVATRIHSQTMLNALGGAIPGFMGGSADLAPSNMTLMKMFGNFQKDSPAERNLRFGVREHAMGAIANGIALHGSGLIPYCATFFIFTDYMRNAMRMAALSEAGTIFVMTHDSIGVGEDGPTHQPIEHLASFRAMPGMDMARPADGNETAAMYKMAVENSMNGSPTTLALSRQVVPNLAGTSMEGAQKGAYVVAGAAAGEACDCILIGTGTELELAVKAGEELAAKGKKVRVSPCRAGKLSIAKRPPTENLSCRPPCTPRLSPSKPVPPSAGPSTLPSPSVAMTSVLPRRRRSCTANSASPPTPWSPLPSKFFRAV